MGGTTRPELLAPAGDRECLKAALVAGADAVYLGGKHFGARAFAANFDEAGLRWARRVTRSLGRKLYLTLNTLIFDDEWPLLEKWLDFCETLQPDALIIQDLGLAATLERRHSQIPRHLSTQGAWDGFGGADVLRHLGISRVILPRETDLSRLRELVQSSPFELEVFVHGAMCYSVSGRCFWSVALGQRSGNRGTCAQPCRKLYVAERGRTNTFFSPRDLRLAPHLSDLAGSGVASLKIEGRMKDAAYVYQVVRVYRQLLDGHPHTEELISELDHVFTRPSHHGFISGTPVANWYTQDDGGRGFAEIGRVSGGRRADGLLEIECRREVRPGDGLAWAIGGRREGARLTWVAALTQKKQHYLVRGLPSLPLDTPLLLSDTATARPWESEWNKEWEREPIDLFWSGHDEQPLAVEFTYKGQAARLTSPGNLARARGQGMEDGPLQERFANLGEHFRAGRHVIRALDRGLFLNPKDLKALKRELVDHLQKMETLYAPAAKSPSMLRPSNGASSVPADESESRHAKPEVEQGKRVRLAVRLWSAQAITFRRFQPDVWILPLTNDPLPISLQEAPVSWWIPPPTSATELRQLIDRLRPLESQDFLCLGWEAFTLARELPHHRFRLDWLFNLVNPTAMRVVQKNGVRVTAAREWPARLPIPEECWRTVAWNPLLSISRFPPSVSLGALFANPHGDRFFLDQIGPGLFGLFLEQRPVIPPPGSRGWVQVDVAFPAHEKPLKRVGELELFLQTLRREAEGT
ncbi:MAG TPA: U32 family peptidase [Candidatus Ozemobacteraceae bacterium]|nr:U32 family peptidase [Candidatus Ozemobacteraceae bacterium]